MVPWGLTAGASATDAVIQKKFESGMATLIISSEELKDAMKVIKSLEVLLKQLKMK